LRSNTETHPPGGFFFYKGITFQIIIQHAVFAFILFIHAEKKQSNKPLNNIDEYA
jgi:hypothetical protein